MFKLIELIKSLTPRIESAQEREQSYLGEAVDLYDLERRIREIDARGQSFAARPAMAAGLR